MSVSETSASSNPVHRNWWSASINRFATPLTTGLFVISAVSGVALFFHWGSAVFHEMHEWLSLVWLVPFAFHAWKNWRSLVVYARRGTLLVPLLASLAVAIPFVYSGLASSGGRGGNPGFRVMTLVTQAHLSDLAPLFKTTPAALLIFLQRRGYQIQSTDDSLVAIAAASHKEPSDVLLDVMSGRTARAMDR